MQQKLFQFVAAWILSQTLLQGFERGIGMVLRQEDMGKIEEGMGIAGVGLDGVQENLLRVAVLVESSQSDTQAVEQMSILADLLQAAFGDLQGAFEVALSAMRRRRDNRVQWHIRRRGGSGNVKRFDGLSVLSLMQLPGGFHDILRQFVERIARPADNGSGFKK
nr:hypothetical protein [Accumulibacter sp.]